MHMVCWEVEVEEEQYNIWLNHSLDSFPVEVTWLVMPKIKFGWAGLWNQIHFAYGTNH
jgi:hypothetical protein